ncbi:MAG: phosphatase PAP2 family protein [Burkholderiales bacterium]|nr:phosphatase PAP2 family protein [Burkholderiales bacterium]
MKCPLSSCSSGCKCVIHYGIFFSFVILGAAIYFSGTNHLLFSIINSWYPLLPMWVWETISCLTYSKFMILQILLLIITYIWRRNKLYNIILLLISYYIIFTIIKHVMHEARPYMVLAPGTFNFLNLFENQTHGAYLSYPSGHVGNMAIFAFALNSMFFEHKRLLQALMFLLIVITAISRICMGWHWPLDVLSSGLIGYLLVKICLCIKFKYGFK